MHEVDQTEASRSVLIEVANVLGAFRDEIVLIGGWVPDLRFPNRNHIGSMDVDLAVSPKAISDNAYETILKRLTEAGYSHQTNPTRFMKSVSGASESVKVDLISGKEAAEGANAVQVNELQLSCLSGVDLAFVASDEMTVLGSMPDGVKNSVRVRIVREEAFILIKAFALDERTKEKDAYDVAFVLRHYEPDLKELARRVKTLLARALARSGFEILRAKFATIDSAGPVWAARVFQEQGEDYEQARRAAYEDAQELFRHVETDRE